MITTNVVDHLLEDLFEIIVEKMFEGDDSNVKEDFTESNLQEKILERCKNAHQVLILNLMNFRKSLG